MIWAKGIQAFVEAAKEIKASFPGARFALVGKPDPGNPNAVPVTQLQAWAEQGVIEWWGYRKDMVEVLRICHIVCFPSTYGEGIPKVLIEAAASGRPIVASDIPGCREVVRHLENGYLVPPSHHRALVSALNLLICDDDLRKRMGLRGRRIFEQTFSLDGVIRDTLELYREALAE
jgi:glycosyltransferase involved in cell wall biosynthesis